MGVILRSYSYPLRNILTGFLVLFVISVIAAAVGSVEISFWIVCKVLISKVPFTGITPDWPESTETILLELRLPRLILAGIVGSALAMSGATYQGLFRNPLADPYLIGVSSGAGLGAVIVLLMLAPETLFGITFLPVSAFCGGVLAVTLAYLIARYSNGTPLATLILAGVAISSMVSAFTAFIMIYSEPEIRPVLNWILGGFSLARWAHVLALLPYVIPAMIVVLSYGRVMNVLQLGEEHAQQLGVNLEHTKLVLIGAATLATAAAVAFSGLIGFVGLIAPHTVRLLWGVDYRSLLPMSAICGACLMILADLVARTIASPSEIPVGIVTAFCGGPFFLYILRRRRTVNI